MLLLRCCAAALLRCSAAALCTQPQSRQLSTAPRRCLHAGLLIRTRRLTSSLPSPVRRQTDTVPLACGQARSLSCGTCQLPARSLSLQLRAVCPTGALQPPRRQPARAFCCPGCLKPSSVCKSVSSSASVPLSPLRTPGRGCQSLFFIHVPVWLGLTHTLPAPDPPPPFRPIYTLRPNSSLSYSARASASPCPRSHRPPLNFEFPNFPFLSPSIPPVAACSSPPTAPFGQPSPADRHSSR